MSKDSELEEIHVSVEVCDCESCTCNNKKNERKKLSNRA